MKEDTKKLAEAFGRGERLFERITNLGAHPGEGTQATTVCGLSVHLTAQYPDICLLASTYFVR